MSIHTEIIGDATLYLGDCMEILPTLDACSADSIITDPPYGLKFMGNNWDHGIPGEHFWREATRVAKPGAFLLAFGGTRTFHRLACAIEDAGWELRDTIMWVYGSGFPKSHNGPWGGTALKPAWEPIIVARKPFKGTVEANWREHGTGGLNIDGCRIELNGDYKCGANGRPSQTGLGDNYDPTKANQHANVGRWPANLVHDGSEEVLAGFPESKSQANVRHNGAFKSVAKGAETERDSFGHSDSGSAARFFYCAKASRSEREAGLREAVATRYGEQGQGPLPQQTPREHRPARNHHPTVKPTELMRWLVRLVTPAGGTVLDSFMGSGSTGKAAALEGFRFVGIEQRAEYLEISSARIGHAQQHAREKAAQLELTLNAEETATPLRRGDQPTHDEGAAQGRAESGAGALAGSDRDTCADSVGAR